MDEGVIKFNLKWYEYQPPRDVEGLLLWKDNLRSMNLLGAYEDGISYGNVSVRTPEGFSISGSGTGKFDEAEAHHFTRVTDYDFEANTVICRGPVPASSESLTHAAIYEADSTVTAVIHVHHKRLWYNMIGKFPATVGEVPYGTPAMVEEIFRLFRDTSVIRDKVFVMRGHEGGVVSFGKSLDKAGQTMLRLYAGWADGN